MNRTGAIARRAFLPALVFLGVMGIHFVWLGVFPDRDPVQSKWADVASPAAESWVTRYVETASYWLGFSYAASLAFAVVAYRRYRASSCGAARKAAIGGLSFSGVLGVTGCFLLGCCGSPMLVVYLNLFGAGFLPFARPLVALVTVIFLSLTWWWMNRRLAKAQCECAAQPLVSSPSGPVSMTDASPAPEKGTG